MESKFYQMLEIIDWDFGLYDDIKKFVSRHTPYDRKRLCAESMCRGGPRPNR